MHRLSRPMIGDSLLTDWQVASAPAGSIADSLELSAAGLSWIPMQAPGTAASALRAAGSWADDSARDFDADDWWFGTMFTASPHVPTRLRFGGLATIAEVWLNDALILQCSDMFIEHTIAVEAQGNNTLAVTWRHGDRDQGGRLGSWSHSNFAGSAHRCSAGCQPGPRWLHLSGRGGRSSC
jgi:beta-mannosidase